MKDIFKLGSILFLICAVAALLLSVTNNITEPVIKERNIQANNESRKEVLKEAEEFKQLDNVKANLVEEVYQGLKGNEVVGYTIKTAPKGYGGKVEVMIGISKDGKITGVKVGNHSETPGLGSKASEPTFKDQFNGKSTEKPLMVVKGSASNDNDIAAISGATITSNAVTSGVNAAINLYKEQLLNNSQNKDVQSLANEPMVKIFDNAQFKKIEGKSEGKIVATYEVFDGNKKIGYIFETELDGYENKTEVLVGITLDGTIKGLELGEKTNDNEHLKSTFDTGLTHQLEGKKIDEISLVQEKVNKDDKSQSASGAKITSKSVIEGVNSTIDFFKKITNGTGA